MGYYQILLRNNANNLCAVIFPWGGYRHKLLPMGVSNSTDIFKGKKQNIQSIKFYICAHWKYKNYKKIDWEDH